MDNKSAYVEEAKMNQKAIHWSTVKHSIAAGLVMDRVGKVENL